MMVLLQVQITTEINEHKIQNKFIRIGIDFTFLFFIYALHDNHRNQKKN